MGARRIEELVAWQLADAFKMEVYDLLRRCPAAQSDRRFVDQLRASAASAAMNIAEGFYRYRPREFARFLSVALGSLGEAALWIRDGIQRGYFDARSCEQALKLATRCRIATLRLRRALG